MQQPWQSSPIIAHSVLLTNSFTQWTKKELLDKSIKSEDLAQSLYESPRVILSHGTEADPIFNYANLAAQRLWNISWNDFIKMPSRLSAEPMQIADRNNLFQKTNQHGYAANYSGVRITKDGRRFQINDALLWKVVDNEGLFYGHAVVFDDWEFI